MSGPASEILRTAPWSARVRPWPRAELDQAGWEAFLTALPAESGLELLGMWADQTHIYALLHDDAEGLIQSASVPVSEGTYLAISPVRPGAALFERMIHDLWGHRAHSPRGWGAHDLRPWIDHGKFLTKAPMSAKPGSTERPEAFQFLAVEGEDGHALAVGPIHAGIIQAGHFRIHAVGERVTRLECRHGYTHKGTLSLMRGQSPRAAARFACRLAGDAAVANALAYAHAVEAALDVAPPPRAQHLRAVMAEIERLANHLADVGAIANDAGFAWPATRTGFHREMFLRAAHNSFGHRLMMDAVIPGGVAVDLSTTAADEILRACDAFSQEWPRLRELLANHTGLGDRMPGVGVVTRERAARFAAGGFVGRASGRGQDARRLPGYAPYDVLEFDVPVREEGDVAARFELRIEEIYHALQLIYQLLSTLPPGALAANVPAGEGEGIGVAEGFRGAAWCWVSISGGQIVNCFIRDPSWLHWPLLEAALQNAVVGDFPLINKSFNASYSGIDL